MKKINIILAVLLIIAVSFVYDNVTERIERNTGAADSGNRVHEKRTGRNKTEL